MMCESASCIGRVAYGTTRRYAGQRDVVSGVHCGAAGCGSRSPVASYASYARSEDVEGEQEQADVEDQRDDDREHAEPRVHAGARDRVDHQRGEDPDADRPDEGKAAGDPREEPGTLVHRHFPDAVHRVLGGVGDAETAVQREQKTEDERETAPAEGMD